MWLSRWLEGLDHVKLRAHLHRAGDEVVPSKGGHHDDARLRDDLLAAHLLHEHVAIHHGHYDIGYQNIIAAFVQALERVDAVGRFSYFFDAFLPAQEIRHAFAKASVVIYNQNTGVHHAEFPSRVVCFLHHSTQTAPNWGFRPK